MKGDGERSVEPGNRVGGERRRWRNRTTMRDRWGVWAGWSHSNVRLLGLGIFHTTYRYKNTVDLGGGVRGVRGFCVCVVVTVSCPSQRPEGVSQAHRFLCLALTS